MWHLLDEAPEGFDATFFEWLYRIEESLSISFIDWRTKNEEEQLQIEFLLSDVREKIPDDVRVYYKHGYPFNHVKQGVSLWKKRFERYVMRWSDRYPKASQISQTTAKLPQFWPIECCHSVDIAAFRLVTGELLVIKIDSESSEVVPITVGLRDYFLIQAAIHILAEDIDSKPDWEIMYKHSRIEPIIELPPVDMMDCICFDL